MCFSAHAHWRSHQQKRPLPQNDFSGENVIWSSINPGWLLNARVVGSKAPASKDRLPLWCDHRKWPVVAFPFMHQSTLSAGGMTTLIEGPWTVAIRDH